MRDEFVLTGAKVYLLDIESVLFDGLQLLPGARELQKTLQNLGCRVVYTTNNSAQNNLEIAAYLNALGFPATPGNVLSSGCAAIRFIRENRAGARVYLVGTPAMQDEFLRQRIELVSEGPDVVVLGFDTTLTYRKLRDLCAHVRRGIEFVATHADLNRQSAEGYIPDIGGVLAFVRATTGRDPDIIIGKPYRYMMDQLLDGQEVAPSQLAVVGGRLATDMEFARRSGALSILIRPESDASIAEPPFSPDFQFSSPLQLAHRLQKLFELERPE